jgi:hypothetical protein
MKFRIRAELTRGDTDSTDISKLSYGPCVGRARGQYSTVGQGQRDARARDTTRATRNRVKFKARPFASQSPTAVLVLWTTIPTPNQPLSISQITPQYTNPGPRPGDVLQVPENPLMIRRFRPD